MTMAADYQFPLTSEEVCEVTGVSYRQLHYWASTGIVPGVAPVGSGRTFEWSLDNVLHVMRISTLVSLGFQLERARQMIGLVDLGLLRP
jgi:DNA-binding transcriptional MerR regulator